MCFTVCIWDCCWERLQYYAVKNIDLAAGMISIRYVFIRQTLETDVDNLPTLLGEKIGADLAGKDEQHSETFVVAAVYERTLFIMTDKGTSAQRFLLLFGQG